MTNKEWLATLSSEDCCRVIDWLWHEYGRGYTDTRRAVIEWLDMRHNVVEFENIKKLWGLKTKEFKTTIEGYVAYYNKRGFNDYMFAPGCFDKCDGLKVPVVMDLNEQTTDDVIGFAELSVKEYGLFAKANIKSNLNTVPKAFTFYANGITRDKCNVGSADVKLIGFDLEKSVDASEITSYVKGE